MMNAIFSCTLTGMLFVATMNTGNAYTSYPDFGFAKEQNSAQFSFTGNWCDGTYTLVADFGAADGTWSWMKDGVAIAGADANQLNLVGLGTGLYTANYQSGTTTITETVQVAELPGPQSHFVFLNDLPIGATRFADSSTPGNAAIVNWQWDFGDGTTSTEKNPVHFYAGGVKKTYTVVMTVTDSNGCSNSTTILVDWN